MSVAAKLRSQRGFTLVELLIVVAIIGVLSTIGVPTFRKMIQKAKKSEAKVNLGGLYTAQQAFYSEYGLFGNNLVSIGFEIDGQNALYAVGFMSADACQTPIAIAPSAHAAGNTTDSSGPLGRALYEAFGGYGAGHDSVLGNASIAKCPRPAIPASFSTATPVNNVFNESGELDAFVAMAIGVISPNVSPTDPSTTGTDVWAINHRRLLSNIQDGVGKRQ